MLLTLEEECCLVGNQITREILGCVHQADDNRSPQVGTLEKVKESGSTTLEQFDLDGPLHHCKRLLSMLFIFGTEAFNRMKGLLLAPLANKPPRRFGAKEYENEEGRLHWSDLRGIRGISIDRLTGKIHCKARGTRHAH